MDSSTIAIRVLIASASVAVVGALIVVGTLRREPEPNVAPQIPVAAHSAPDASQKQQESTNPKPSLRAHPKAPHPNQNEQPLSPPIYAGLPVIKPVKPARIDYCFVSDMDVTAPPSSRETAIIGASLNKDWGTVRRMLDAGAPVESANEAGITPLMIAAAQGSPEAIGLLLRRHANANLKDLTGRSALCYAIQSGKLAAVQSLLPVSDREISSSEGHDPFTAAVESGDIKILGAVLERFPAEPQWTQSTRSALQAAVRAERKDEVCLLMSGHTEPTTLEGEVVPLIAYAIATDNTKLFETLLSCGADPNSVIPKNAEQSFLSVVKSKYLRLYIQEETGINLLMLAAGLEKTDYVRALLDAGADRKRATPRERMLPLYFAAWTQNWKCVQLLLGGGPLPDQLRVEISLAKQRMSVIKDGVTIFTSHCSTGRQGFKTPAGEYVITDKEREHRSTIYKVPMPYFMRLSCRDFGMHAGAVASYPVSHGCIRLPEEAARKLFTELPVGTVVMIN
jgi:ankyrin repeat protein